MEPRPSNHHEPGPPANSANDAARRWETIRQLGASQPPDTPPRTAPALPVMPRRSPLGRRWQAWLITLILAAVVVGLAVALAPRAGAPKARARPPAPVQIVVSHDLIECPTDMAWSRNQQLIAVLGYAGSCPNPDYEAGGTILTQGVYRGPLARGSQDGVASQGALAIYSSSKGKLVAQERLDSAIYPLIHFAPSYVDWMKNAVHLGPETMAAINYTRVLWSFDSQRLYVTFTIYAPDAPPTGDTLPGHLLDGLLVTDLQGTSPRVYLHPAASRLGGVTVWDVATGAVRSSIPATSPFALSPTGLGYTWSGDTLAVQQPTPQGPVGEPGQGAPVFSIWQPGAVGGALILQKEGQKSLDGVPTFTMDTAALSPDGSLLAAGIGLSAVLVSSATPAPAAPQLTTYGWGQASHLPLRDAALSAAAAASIPNGGHGAWRFGLTSSTIAVAWRPDGREMAMVTGGPDASGYHQQVTILDCATGKTLATLTPPPYSVGIFYGEVNLLRWAPDGRRLAFYDQSKGVVTIWDQALLPR
jgi:WD40 repeat protein